MTSCEPAHCSAYSNDLRWRMVWQTEALEHSNEQAAKNLGVDKSTVSQIQHKFLISDSIEKKAYPKDKAYRKPGAAQKVGLVGL